MKSILTAGIISLIIHGLVFSLDFNWPGSASLEHPIPMVLNMTVTSVYENTTPNPPLKTKPEFNNPTMDQQRRKPVLNKQTLTEKKKKPVLKKKTPIKKSQNQPKLAEYKPLDKATPLKPVQVPLQPKTEKASKTIAEHSDESEASDLESKNRGEKTASKVVEHAGASLSPLATIHEAKPAYRSNPSPEYPRIARIRGFQGNVLLDVLVNADGKVDDVQIFKSSGYPILDRSAKSTVKQWLFEPGRIGKRKVQMWVRVPIRFELME